MKSLIRRVLFSLIALPIAACGGDREVSTPPEVPPLVTTTPDVAAPVIAPVTKLDRAPVDIVEPLAVPATYADALAVGKQLAGKGDHARAKEMFEAASKLDKKQADPHIELARLFITSGERALAIRSATRAVKLAPASSHAYNTLGRAELARFHYDNAIDAFRQATELDPDNVWAWNNLGYVHLQHERFQEAADALVEATSRAGTTGYMWNNLGTAYEHLDQLEEAREAFEQGGVLGSVAARSSRKRLEGVDSIAIYKAKPAAGEGSHDDPVAPSAFETYETREEMPELPVDEAVEDVAPVEDAVDSATEPAVDDEPAVEDEPAVDDEPAPMSPV